MRIRIWVAGSLLNPRPNSLLEFTSIKGLFETLSRKYPAQTVDRPSDICGLVNRERLGILLLNRHPTLAGYEEVQSAPWDSLRTCGPVGESGGVYIPRRAEETGLLCKKQRSCG